DYALSHYGKRSLKEHLLKAATIAERGFKIDGSYARVLAATAKELAQFDESRQLFLRADRSAYRKGELLKQPELADTYRHIAQDGIDWFYRGDFAQKAG